MQAIWAKGKNKEKNCTLAFTYDLSAKRGDVLEINLTASNIYKLYINDQLIGYGPARAAHGYTRQDKYERIIENDLTFITVEVVSYNVNSYYLIDEEPFFGAVLKLNGFEIAQSKDFMCYHLDDRIQKVQRYSFQRPFIEDYVGKVDRKDFYLRKANPFKNLETVRAKDHKILDRNIGYPNLTNRKKFLRVENGTTSIDQAKPVWKDRSICDIGKTLKGFKYEELEDKVSDYVSKFVYNSEALKPIGRYELYETETVVAGLINIKVNVLKACEIYLIFDEIVWDEENNSYVNSEKNISFYRINCCNIVKWKLGCGEYNLSTFEIYTLKYAKVIIVGGECEINSLNVTEVKNPNGEKLTFSIEDEQLQAIMNSAKNTYCQNAFDVLMDCPSRERAGWTNDSYFACEADMLFSGERRVEYNFLENLLIMPRLKELPKGMLPMCYPCDHYDGVYIPNCAIWVILEMFKYYKLNPNTDFKNNLRKKCYDLIKYFKKYKNSDGLLENLDGWIFIEWSVSNELSHTCGVNYPSNMMYYQLIKQTGEIFDDQKLIRESTTLKNKIIEQSYNGTYFEDNRVRENGKLTFKGHVTETCQYYAFFFEIASKEQFSALYEKLLNDYGFDKADQILPRSNIIIGYCLRQELLVRYQENKRIIDECKAMFFKMANRTGTLWEHTGIEASCDHGISADCANWIIYALTGYKGVKNGIATFDKLNLETNCNFCIPYGGKYIKIRVAEGNLFVSGDFQYSIK